MISEVNRDKDGLWFHPSFPWNDIREEANITSYIENWGYEAKFILMQYDASDEIQNRYDKADSPDCSYWTPTKPDGEGWILGAIYDTEDGPCACWLRPITKPDSSPEP